MVRADLPSARIKYYPDTFGTFTSFSGTGKPVAMLSAHNGRGSLALRAEEKGTVGAVVGVTPGGSGALSIFDENGKLREEVRSALGFRAFNPSGQAVAEFGSNESGSSGRFWLGNAQGDGIVEGGMLGDGRGTIRVGPEFGGPAPGIVMPDRLVGRHPL